jgi:hypothetical protein
LIIQIVPRRTDRPDGVGDYGTLLAHAILEQVGSTSVFVCGTPARTEAPRTDQWQNVPVLCRKGRSLAERLSELCRNRDVAAVILHVSGYGYAKRGAPSWLLEGMLAWRHLHIKCRLFGIFHELFATGRVWNSSFWLSGVQKYITRELWDLCDGGFATTSVYFNQLAAWRPDKEHLLRTMPVFSNVGEPSRIVPIDERPLNMAVFGQPGVEQKIYLGRQYELSASIAKEFGILNIADIGARTVKPPRHLGQVPITALGQLPQNCVSRHLMSCRFGLLNYDVGRLEKSGVFAGYAAHGVIPICIGSEAPPCGLEEGRHFLRWPLKTLPDLRGIQRNLIQWYGGHSILKHVDLLKSWCLPQDGSQGNAKNKRH